MSLLKYYTVAVEYTMPSPLESAQEQYKSKSKPRDIPLQITSGFCIAQYKEMAAFGRFTQALARLSLSQTRRQLSAAAAAASSHGEQSGNCVSL